jgi:hypothetical protein
MHPYLNLLEGVNGAADQLLSPGHCPLDCVVAKGTSALETDLWFK